MSCINLLLLYYCSWTPAILPPWVFHRSRFQSFGACRTPLCEFRQAKKKISHVSSIPAALRGFLFAIQLFLILTVVLLFAGEIIILSRRRAISLLSRVVSDGFKKCPSHKAHRVGRKGISRPLAAARFGKCLPFGQSKRLEGRGHAARAAVSVR